MSLQEKKAVFSILSSLLILGGYFYYTFGIHADENLPLQDNVQFWASFTLTMIVVTIILKIIAHIIFNIILAATNEGEDPEFMDEFDKKIELLSDRNGNYIFVLGFISSMIPVAMGKPVYYMFLILLIGGFVGGTLSDLWKIYYYRKGV